MYYLINVDKMVVVNKFKSEVDADQIGQKSKFKYLVVSSAKDLEQFTLKHLTDLRSNLTGLSGKVDNKGKHCPKIWEAMESLQLEEVKIPEKKAKKASGPKKDKAPSKSSKIRELFTKKDSVTRDEIIAATGFDERNAHTTMKILGNRSRTKEPLLTGYDRKTKTYTLIKRPAK